MMAMYLLCNTIVSYVLSIACCHNYNLGTYVYTPFVCHFPKQLSNIDCSSMISATLQVSMHYLKSANAHNDPLCWSYTKPSMY